MLMFLLTHSPSRTQDDFDFWCDVFDRFDAILETSIKASLLPREFDRNIAGQLRVVVPDTKVCCRSLPV